MNHKPLTTLTVRIPHLPDRRLSPNARVVWQQRYIAAQEAKDEAQAIVRAETVRGKPWELVAVTITWRSEDKRRRDWDNLLAATKPYLDGMVAAGVMADDSTQAVLSLSLEYERLAHRDETEITVTKV